LLQGYRLHEEEFLKRRRVRNAQDLEVAKVGKVGQIITGVSLEAPQEKIDLEDSQPPSQHALEVALPLSISVFHYRGTAPSLHQPID
jgi:hypothetical protein